MNAILPELSDKCFACRLLETVKGRRLYFEDDDYLIFENLNTMTPVLIARNHGIRPIPFNSFQQLKKICSKLYGDCYCLNLTPCDDDHYCIKVVRLTSAVQAM